MDDTRKRAARVLATLIRQLTDVADEIHHGTADGLAAAIAFVPERALPSVVHAALRRMRQQEAEDAPIVVIPTPSHWTTEDEW